MNPEVEELRAALWTVYWDAREENISGELAHTLGQILAALAQLAEVEAFERQGIEGGGPTDNHVYNAMISIAERFGTLKGEEPPDA